MARKLTVVHTACILYMILFIITGFGMYKHVTFHECCMCIPIQGLCCSTIGTVYLAVWVMSQRCHSAAFSFMLMTWVKNISVCYWKSRLALWLLHVASELQSPIISPEHVQLLCTLICDPLIRAAVVACWMQLTRKLIMVHCLFRRYPILIVTLSEVFVFFNSSTWMPG
jgi:hypothetical protein